MKLNRRNFMTGAGALGVISLTPSISLAKTEELEFFKMTRDPLEWKNKMYSHFMDPKYVNPATAMAVFDTMFDYASQRFKYFMYEPIATVNIINSNRYQSPSEVSIRTEFQPINMATKYDLELIQDLKAIYSLDVDEELSDFIREDISREIDRHFIVGNMDENTVIYNFNAAGTIEHGTIKFEIEYGTFKPHMR